MRQQALRRVGSCEDFGGVDSFGSENMKTYYLTTRPSYTIDRKCQEKPLDTVGISFQKTLLCFIHLFDILLADGKMDLPNNSRAL